MRFAILLSTLALLLAAPAGAQDDPFAKDEKKLYESASRRLMTFARVAERHKVFSRAKEAYELVITHYEPQNTQALKALGWEKVGGEWKEPETQKRWPDDSNDEGRFEVIGDWRRFAEGLAEDHRELAVAMLESQPARAVYHLRMALYFNPHDIEAHKALGHQEWEGFWGTEADVAFVKRMRDLEKYAATLAQKEDYAVEPIQGLPAELQVMVAEDGEIEFFGAKSDTFTIFCRGTQKNADDCVKWAERACDFLEYALPPDARKRIDIRKHMKGTFGYLAFIWTTAEQKAFIRLNPQLNANDNFRNVHWGANGKINEVTRALTPATMFDKLIGLVWKSVGGNDATNEGFMHAACWYLRATAITRYGAEQTGTTTGAERILPDSANWWLREMRDQATGRTDFPMNNIPRVQLSDFKNEARLKTWSMGVWMLARYPEKWVEYLFALPESEVRPFPEKVDEIVEKVLGRPRAEIEEEWRGWAAGRTLAAEFTGYGPPLLPEKPNDDQIKGLMRLNEFRALIGLPMCEIDLEATLACRDHALFLQQNPDHWVWPEAHEEDPAKPGYSTRGMRAGLRSVIVISPDGDDIDPADSLDGWLGTVYHRFPLLEPNIRRIGFAAEGNVVVLDMGSLEEPRTTEHENKFRWVLWPPDGMSNVPRTFHANEYPDPLADTPEAKAEEEFRVQQAAGYPVSLQMARHIANQLLDARLSMFSMKKRGREYVRDEVVPCWIHTPKTPLLKRMENPLVIFGIPKEHLEANTTYEVVVELDVLAGTDEVKWKFETGPQPRGHGRLKMPKEK